MREAKLAVSVFGVISACLIGGGVVAYNAAPQVSTRDSFEIVEPAYQISDSADNGVTLPAEQTSDENKTAITEPKKEKTEEKMTVAEVYNRASPVKLSKIAQSTDNVTAATTVATTFQSVTEADTYGSTDQAAGNTAASDTTYEYTNDYNTESTTEPTTYQEATYDDPTTNEPATEATEPVTEPVTEEISEPDTEPATEDVIVTVPSGTATDLPISESDFILLCNVVAHEAGCYWIGPYEKAYVVEVVMNRVNSPLFPNTIYGVLTQPNQFSGSGAYVNLGTYASYVTESVKEAVRLYFSEPESFTQGYLSFYGDGVRNYFR